MLRGSAWFATATAVAGEITLFEYPDFGGRRVTLRGSDVEFRPIRLQRPRRVDGHTRRLLGALHRRLLPRALRDLRTGRVSHVCSPRSTDTISSAREVGGPPPAGRPPRPPSSSVAARRASNCGSAANSAGARSSLDVGCAGFRAHRIQRSRRRRGRVCRRVAPVRARRSGRPMPRVRSGPLQRSGLSRRQSQLGGHRRRLGGGVASRRRPVRCHRARPRAILYEYGEFRRTHASSSKATSFPTSTAPASTTAHRRSASRAATGCSAPTPDSRARAAPSVPVSTLRCRGRSTTGFRRAVASPSIIPTTPRRHGARRAETHRCRRSTTSPDCAASCATAARSRSSGLSANWYRPSYFAAKYMQDHGYRIIPGQSELPRSARPEVLRRPALRFPTRSISSIAFASRRRWCRIARDAVAIHARVLWMQLGIRNHEAAKIAIDAGLDVVMDRCVKIEHARILGGLNWAGVNTGVISARRPRSARGLLHGRSQIRLRHAVACTRDRFPMRRPARARCRSTRRRRSCSTAPITPRACSTCRPSATSTRAFPIRRSPRSRSASPRSRADAPRSPPPPAWPRR